MTLSLAFVSVADPHDPASASGLAYYMSRALIAASTRVQYVAPLQPVCSVVEKLRTRAYKLGRRGTYLANIAPLVLRRYAAQIGAASSALHVDAIFSDGAVPISYLDTRRPVFFWTDATFQALLGFYPEFCNLAPRTIREGHDMQRRALARARLAIFSSDWAANTALSAYGAPRERLSVVPFGANTEARRTYTEIRELVASRRFDCCRLLFAGADWERKGGDRALAITRELNRQGLRTELTLLGARPPASAIADPYVKLYPFIPKTSPEGARQLEQVFAESHFLLLPSRADCTPHVLCEASGAGVPSLATAVGGIPTVVRDDVNGKLFADDDASAPSAICSYVMDLMRDPAAYRDLAVSSFVDFEARLNWDVAARTVKRLVEAAL